jgi:tetratricopeptide (TPR) repeat protein
MRGAARVATLAGVPLRASRNAAGVSSYLRLGLVWGVSGVLVPSVALVLSGVLVPSVALGADGPLGAPSPVLRECLAASPAGRSGPWQRARTSQLAAYCDELARAWASLNADPGRARAAAERAEGLLPGRAAPLLLQGQAATREGKYEQAASLFRRAAERDPQALDDPRSLRDFARSVEEAEGHSKAADAYRRLSPLASALPGDERAQALIGAAIAVGARGPEALDESLALLRSALQEGPPSLQPALYAALALGLDRRGARAEATAMAERARRTGAIGWLDEAKRGGDEWVAARARLLEGADLSAATSLWQTFLRGPGGRGPWAAHARARLADLSHVAPAKKP